VFLESKTRLHNENVSMFIALHISGSLFVLNVFESGSIQRLPYSQKI
jgi:hypothetical protein